MERDEVKQVFLDALDVDTDAREAFLDDKCAGRADLRREVDELLEWALESEFLAGPSRDEPPDPEPARAIGPYTIIRELGRGGFGTVFLASQDRPIRRNVAIKILHQPLNARQVLERFAGERRALERMNHPGIAQILDAGLTDQDVPYVVLEYVEGPPITAWCDEHDLDVRERVELMEQVALAVRHAHRNGIIHRDIKPSNVLVGMVDDRPVVKIIDFGIAKATSTDDADTMLTQEHQLLGTPRYMSPEQARGSIADVDTRTDVYSLGVVLFELLTGRTPFDALPSGTGEPTPLARVASGVDPPRPSAVRRSLRGDLECVVMKALQPEADQRYDSAAALARDLRRYLDGDAVEATPPSRAYRLRKFARRHRVALSMCGVVAVALAVALSALVAGSLRAQNAAQEAIAINDFVNEILSTARPEQGGSGALVLDAIQDSMDQLDERFADQPRVAVGVREMIGDILLSHGECRKATIVLERAYELAGREFGVDAPRTLEIGFRLLTARAADDTAEQIEQLSDELLPRFVDVFGRDDARTIEVERSRAVLSIRRGSPADAAEHIRATLERAIRVLGPEHRVTIRTHGNLAMALMMTEDPAAIEESLAIMEEIRPLVAARGRDLPSLEFRAALARIEAAVGNLDAAAAVAEGVIADVDGVVGPSHWIQMFSRSALATALFETGNAVDGAPHVEMLVDTYAARRGEGHPVTLSAMDSAVPIVLAAGRFDVAERYARELTTVLRAMGGMHGALLRCEAAWAWAMIGLDRLTEADHLLTQADTSDASAADRATLDFVRAEYLIATDDAAAAEVLLGEVLAVLRTLDEPPLYLREHTVLSRAADLADERGDDERARELRNERAARLATLRNGGVQAK